MKQPSVIFLCGPKGVGKSTLALALQRHFRNNLYVDYMMLGCSEPLNRATVALHYSSDPFIDLKDQAIRKEPLPNFAHVKKFDDTMVEVKGQMVRDMEARPYVLRDWQIGLGNFIRNTLGKDALSRILLHIMKENEQYYLGFILEGVRFPEDIDTMLEHFGKENCVLIRIHRDGLSFEGDLGGYLNDPGCAAFDVENNATLDDLLTQTLEKLNA